MKQAAVICFTEKGRMLAHKIKEASLELEYDFSLYAKYKGFREADADVCAVEEALDAWTLSMQEKRIPLVFIGAMGIAVRAIAGGLQSKLTDAPVVVLDELGRHVIPVVSGHIGGANELAMALAEVTGANPVITTATDLGGQFSVDLFAKENGLSIYNKDGIAKVSAKALEGKAVRISIENYPPENTDVVVSHDQRMKRCGELLLCPREYAVGIGCRKGTPFSKLRDYFIKTLAALHIETGEVGAIASIDLKEEEQGLIELCAYYKLPFITYTSELLEKAEGDYEESAFVKEKTGVGNVCERAAMLLTGNRGKLIQRKSAEDGMTIAIAKME